MTTPAQRRLANPCPPLTRKSMVLNAFKFQETMEERVAMFAHHFTIEEERGCAVSAFDTAIAGGLVCC